METALPIVPEKNGETNISEGDSDLEYIAEARNYYPIAVSVVLIIFSLYLAYKIVSTLGMTKMKFENFKSKDGYKKLK